MELEREYLRGARRKARAAKDYFDDDDDDDAVDQSSHAIDASDQQQQMTAAAVADDDNHDDEVDPLDAFMMDIETQVVQERAQTHNALPKPDVLNQDDDADAYMADYARATGHAGADDSDDEVYAAAERADPDSATTADTGTTTDRKQPIAPLAPVDFAHVAYAPIQRCTYLPHADVLAMTSAAVAALRRHLGVRVDGANVPHPVQSFALLGLERPLLDALAALGLTAPTPIQAQAVPAALDGRDVLGLAQTGSGKTLAFALPLVRHVLLQVRSGNREDGPVAVVLAPTRELAHQIFVETRKLVRGTGINTGTTGLSVDCAAVYGGVGKWEQIQALRRGAAIVVATPGRLIELVRKRAATLTTVSFVVLDEADRMFELGFEPQLRSVLGQVRPDRQTLLFSATCRSRIEALARDVLTNPVKVLVGAAGQASDDIAQTAVVLPHDRAKWPWLADHIASIAAAGRALVFAASKAGCETLAASLQARGVAAQSLHGDKAQSERAEALKAFRLGTKCRILVATDVAARGLDVKDVRTVVNYDVAKSIDLHVHRIGRTGRMGVDGVAPGTAITLVTPKDSAFAAALVHNMDVAGQFVSPELLAVAARDPRFRRGSVGPKSGATAATRTNRVDATRPVAVGNSGNSDERDDSVDADEMARWHESRRTSKADQRKGLGFAGRGGGQFRPASVPASALSASFQSAFVKATSSSNAAPATPKSLPQAPAVAQQAPVAWTAPAPTPVLPQQQTLQAPPAMPPSVLSLLPTLAPPATAAVTTVKPVTPLVETKTRVRSDASRSRATRSRSRSRSRSTSSSSSSSSRSLHRRSSSSRRRRSRSASRSRSAGRSRSRGRRRDRRSISSSRSRSRSRSHSRRQRLRGRSRSPSRSRYRGRRYSRSQSPDRRSRYYR